jgi:hypothetical protein
VLLDVVISSHNIASMGEILALDLKLEEESGEVSRKIIE